MKKSEFKIRMNPAILYFEIFYIVAIVMQIFDKEFSGAIATAVVGLLIFAYLNLWRPYKYTIERRTLILNRRIGKNKEVNLMTCETICDPVPKMTKIITNPRALEIYAEGKSRLVVTPKERIEFIEAVVATNKRIHVQCKEYAATHRSYEKKRRKALKEEAKKAKKANLDA